MPLLSWPLSLCLVPTWMSRVAHMNERERERERKRGRLTQKENVRERGGERERERGRERERERERARLCAQKTARAHNVFYRMSEELTFVRTEANEPEKERERESES